MRLLLLLMSVATLPGQVNTAYRVPPPPPPDTPDRIVFRYEQPLRDLAREWIRDPQPERRRWAAKLLAMFPDQALNSELIQILRDPFGNSPPAAGSPASVSELGFMHQTTLSTLIQTDISVPEDVALSMFNSYPAEASILLYRNFCPS